MSNAKQNDPAADAAAKADEAAAATEAARVAEQEAAAAKAKADAEAAAQPKARVVKPDAKAKADAEPTTKLTQVRVLIFRNEQTQISDVVFEHELPVLRRLHGNEQVRILGDEEVEVANFSADAELQRLQRKYNSKEGAPVDTVFNNDPRELARVAGVTYSASANVRKPASSTQRPAKKKVIGKGR